MTLPTFLPEVGPFSCVSHDEYIDHGKHGCFRVVLYGTYNAHGSTQPEKNGIGILIEPSDRARGAVVCDELGQEATSHHHPSAMQIELYQSILAMPWKEFQATVNSSGRKCFKL